MKIFLLIFLILLLCPVFVLASDKVEINTASLEQLDKIIGVGPVIAQRIIDARPFSSVDDLLRVKGIGEITLQKIKDQGLAYVENQDMQPILQTPIKTPPETPREALAEPLDVLPTETPPQDVVVPIVYPTGIVINEILPSPEGPDAEEEWIETYNRNNFEVDLAGWKIQDREGKSTAYLFPSGAKLGPLNYLILTRPLTKITLNNTGDKLMLLQPNGEIVDIVEYQKAPRGQSYNRIDNNWQWSNTLTSGLTNIIKNGTIEKTQSDNKEKTENILKNGLTAALNQNTKQLKPFSSILLIASILAIVLTTIFFFLKTKFKKT